MTFLNNGLSELHKLKLYGFLTAAVQTGVATPSSSSSRSSPVMTFFSPTYIECTWSWGIFSRLVSRDHFVWSGCDFMLQLLGGVIRQDAKPRCYKSGSQVACGFKSTTKASVMERFIQNAYERR